MKKLLFLAVALVLIAGVALADPIPDPVVFSSGGYTMVTTYQWNGSAWVALDKRDTWKTAATYTSGGAEGSCNKQVWTVDIVNAASIAQWIDWGFSDTRWDWQVRKPGTYCADCISFTIQSNADVDVAFIGFGPLYNPAYQTTIPVWYALGDAIEDFQPGGTPVMNWMPALATSDETVNGTLPLRYETVANGVTLKFWTKIQVDPSTHACEYMDAGKITLTATVLKPWIHFAEGDFFTCVDYGYSCADPHFLAPDGKYYYWPGSY